MKILSGLYRNIELTQTIDKAFLLGYNFDRNGRFIKWSNIQKLYNDNLFNISMRIPIPDTYHFAKFDENVYDNIMVSLFTDFETVINSEGNFELLAQKYGVTLSDSITTNSDMLQLAILAEILERERTIGGIIINKSVVGIYNSHIDALLRRHHNTKPNDAGMKNYATHQMHEIMNSPKNAVTAYKSIDTATDAFAIPIKNLPKEANRYIDDGHAITKGTEDGAIGKLNVGIAANGTKSEFTLVLYYNKEMTENPPLTVEELKYAHYFNHRRITLVYGKDENGNDLKWSKVLVAVGDTQVPKSVKRLYYEACGTDDIYFYTEDAAQAVGALLSMAADNAKTLYMNLLHAMPDIFKMHIYLAMIGCPGDIIVQYFNSPYFQELVRIKRMSNEKLEVRLNEKLFTDIALSESEPERQQEAYDNLMVYLSGQEVSTLASILAINQGIKVDEIEFIKRVLKLQKVFKDAVVKGKKDSNSLFDVEEYSDIYLNWANRANSQMQTLGITLDDDFDLRKFLTDTNYAECIKSIYDVVKINYNIFDVIDKAPHFRMMLMLYLNIVDFYKLGSAKIRIEVDDIPRKFDESMNVPNGNKKPLPLYYQQYTKDDTADELDEESQVPPTKDFELQATYNPDKYAKAAAQTIDNTVLENFIREIITTSSFEYTNNKGTDLEVSYTCDFKTDNALHSFVDFMNAVVIPILRRDYSDNKFIQGYYVNDFEAKRNLNMFYLFEVTLNTMVGKDMSGLGRLKGIKKDFNKIKDIPLISLLAKDAEHFHIGDLNTTVGDFLYLYDQLGSKVVTNFSPIAMLFTDYSPETFKGKFHNFWKSYDIGQRVLDIDPAILLATILKPLVKFKKTTGGGKKSISFRSGNVKEITYSEVRGDTSYTKYLLGMPVLHEIPTDIIYGDMFTDAILDGRLLITELNIDCE